MGTNRSGVQAKEKRRRTRRNEIGRQLRGRQKGRWLGDRVEKRDGGEGRQQVAASSPC